jgi:hypothetical protein
MSVSSTNQGPRSGDHAPVTAIFTERARAEDALRELSARGFVAELVAVAIRDDTTRLTVYAGHRDAEAREILRRWGGREAAEEPEDVPAPTEADERAEVVAPEGPPIHPRSEVAPEPPPVIRSPVADQELPAQASAATEPRPPPPAVASYYGPLPATTQPPTVEIRAIRRGWVVYSSDGARLGVVQEVNSERLRVDRGPLLGSVFVPFRAIRSTEHDEVHLDVPGDSIDEQGWRVMKPLARDLEEVPPTMQHEYRGAAREMMGSAQEAMRGVREGDVSDTVGGFFSFLETIPNSTYYFAMVGSIFASLWLFVSGKRWESLFVGLWAPTIITSAMFYKLIHPSRETHRMM